MSTDDRTHFIDRLCAAFPDIENKRREHLRDYDEMLFTVFLADVARHAERLYAEPRPDELRRLLQFIEAEFAEGPESVREIIHLGFLEALGGPPAQGWRIREELGPTLRATIEKIWPSTGYAKRHGFNR